MKRTLIMLAALVVAGGLAAAQDLRPGTPEQVAAAVAEAPGSWADEAVTMLVERGLYIGYPDGTFRWRESTSRAEMAMVIARLIKSFDLEKFDPNEVALLRSLLDRLGSDVGDLRDLLFAHDEDLYALAEEVARNSQEIAGLLDAIERLEAAQAAARSDLDAVLAAIDGLDTTDAAASTASAEHVAALADKLSDLAGRLADVAGVAAGNARDFDALRAALNELKEDADANAALTSDLQDALEALTGRVGELADAQAGLEAGLEAAGERLDDHEARISRLEEKLLPDRAPFYVSLAVYGSDPAEQGLIGQVMIGHDSIIDNLGARLSVDFGFDEIPLSVSGDLTVRATHGAIDGYAGIGGGAQFKADETVPFGELILGVQYRMLRNVALFAEGRYRPYFNDTGDHQPAVFGGVQIRF